MQTDIEISNYETLPKNKATRCKYVHNKTFTPNSKYKVCVIMWECVGIVYVGEGDYYYEVLNAESKLWKVSILKFKEATYLSVKVPSPSPNLPLVPPTPPPTYL